MTRPRRDAPTRAGRRALLARAAGLAAAGLAIDAAAHRRAARRGAARRTARSTGCGRARSPRAARRIRARVTIDGPVRLLLTRADGRDAASPHSIAPTGPPSTDGVHTFDADGLQPDTAYRYADRDGSRPRRAHRPVPHLRRRAVLVRLRLRLVRDDRVEQRDLRRHPRPQAALLPAPRRLPLRQHHASTIRGASATPRTACCARRASRRSIARRRSSTSSTTTTSASTMRTARR